MADAFKVAVEAVSAHLGKLQPRMKTYHGYLGDGSGTVRGSQWNYLFVRYPATNSPAVEVFNGAAVQPVNNLRVIVGYLPEQPLQKFC